MNKKLTRNFFEQNTIKVAKLLLGKFLVRKIGKKIIKARIVETEAYHGFDDKASHASKSRTERNDVMFGNAGVAYVYFVYGMHYMFNIVCGKKDFPAAVLIRSVNIEGVDKKMTNGPAKLCNILRIDKSLNKEDLIFSNKLWLEDMGVKIEPKDIKSSERVGVSYAGGSAKLPWRFYIK
jgi:DNA-3-methyladenine glycosylase